jgi:hypothetical protein
MKRNDVLTNLQKQSINRVLEDWSRLQNIQINFGKRTAVIRLFVSKDAETDKCYEIDDLTWRQARDQAYEFKLSGLGKIQMSVGKEVLPKELSNIKTPSREFILFAASLFEQQGIYEWNCFSPGSTRFKDAWEPSWTLKISEDGDDHCISFFKERNNSVWVIGFWFADLAIEDAEPITIEEFLSRYPTRLGTFLGTK